MALAIVCCFGMISATPPAQHGVKGPPAIATELVATGLQEPVCIATPRGENKRLFVVERYEAKVRIVRDHAVEPVPFLDLDKKVIDGSSEQGFLSLAFHPNYAKNRFFYVHYNDKQGDTVIARYKTRKRNPDRAKRKSRMVMYRVDQPAENHNGGMLAFGPDGYLYLALGDGGGSNAPAAQDISTPFGKLLRFDVDSAEPYAIPPDNPFAATAGANPLTWAYGLRNPWNFSFDRETGDIWIGDVGRLAREELDFQPASSPGGENYGWPIAEGFACNGGMGTCGTNPGFTPPIYDYDRTVGTVIIGGRVYRGKDIPGLQGTYFFANFFTPIWSMRYDGTNISEFADRTAELDPPGDAKIEFVTCFGEDGRGELYVNNYYKGEIYKIVPAPTKRP